MNISTPPPVAGSQLPLNQRKKGIALIVVLSFLLLISGLVLSFFLSITTETKATRQADNASRSKELVDTTTNIVMAQIRAATTRGANVAWASQPGMIRTYGTSTGTASANPLTYYKLYSATEMTWEGGSGSTPFNPSLDVPTNWYTTPALYTDLNLPVTDLSNVKQYPIVDPSTLALPATERPQGFDIPEDKTPTQTSGVINRAPMPTRWLYILKDGTLTSPVGGTEATENVGAKAEWVPTASDAPTLENPIVGRVAFWTDDDTSKININTAAGDMWTTSAEAVSYAGSYWDWPRTFTDFDKTALANYQPANSEFQRYPGHPATTYLSAVFPKITQANIGAIAARVQSGGSSGGTRLYVPDDTTNPTLPLDADRLYASIDELTFKPDRTLQSNATGASGFTQSELEQRRFFLTAHSRSPEVNLFNKPRITIWPISSNTGVNYRTAYDRLIAFCSQIGGNDYYISRTNADDPTIDFATTTRNYKIYQYLQNLTSANIPGFGGSFVGKYPVAERNQILTEICDYIRSTNLFDDSLPTSYTADLGQFTNRRTSATGSASGHGQVAPLRIGDSMGFGRFLTISEAAMHFICTAEYGDNNINPGDALNDARLASNNVTDVPEVTTGEKPRPAYRKNKTLATKLTAGQKRIEAMLILELFSPAQGWTGLHPDMSFRITGLQNFAVDGVSLGMPSDATTRQTGGNAYNSRDWGGSMGFRFFLNGRRTPVRGIVPADSNWTTSNSYPFISIPITISPVGASRLMDFTGGPITIEVYSGFDTTKKLVQTINMVIPDQDSIPSPNLVTSGTVEHSGADSAGVVSIHAPATTKENWWTFSNDGVFPAPFIAGRFTNVSRYEGNNDVTHGPRSGAFIRKEDVIRSVMPSHGDYRLVAASATVTPDVYKPHRDYSSSVRLAHNLVEATGTNQIQREKAYSKNDATTWPAGKMVTTADYSNARFPDMPFNVTAANDSGDWDTANSIIPDGAYINKPDEGNNYRNFGGVPYFDVNWAQESGGATFFSPNRQISSPVMFGSLPNQLVKQTPWSTLLFRPDISSTSPSTHIGAQSPKDHLLLDLFWMPVVEPYAISEPFSTAGKVNMNYQLMPFTYIERSTALRAVLKGERIIATPLEKAATYKTGAGNLQTRFPINNSAESGTLKQFEERFASGDIFRSASEICDIHLIPEGKSITSSSDAKTQMRNYWELNKLTGDNSRERPYTGLYPRLTTKSNTYTVHYRVQALQQTGRSRAIWANWEEGKDLILSETRGSTTIERYIDAADPGILDYTSPSTTQSLDERYRFRVISNKKFSP